MWLGNGCNPSSEGNHQQYAEGQQVIHIKDKRGNHIVRLVWDSENTMIESDQQFWSKPAGSTTYRTEQLPLVEIQTNGLEITATTKVASWQIRFLDDTMHILQLGNSPKVIYQVAQPQTDKFWVYKAGREVGKTKIKNGMIDVDGYGIDLKIPAQTNAYAYTLLMMYDIPETIRFTLMIELLKKGI
ncbi:hypothetical protein BKI52_00130 [marine bacterium AO1-C]|nr:hypothetical protein BKI52_00130 [marine bacterium AO1-C]